MGRPSVEGTAIALQNKAKYNINIGQIRKNDYEQRHLPLVKLAFIIRNEAMGGESDRCVT
jgi:hypothetical protein